MTPELDATSELSRSARRRRRSGRGHFFRDLVVILLIAMVASFLIKTFVVRSFYIPSGSMEATLQISDRILVDEVSYRFGAVQRGDVIVFSDPGGWLPQRIPEDRGPVVEVVDWVLSIVGISAPDSKDHLIKRVIGVEGDHVVCCNAIGQITVNGVPINEKSYLQLPNANSPASADPFDVVVPEDSLWVMGDNRNHSEDSRYHPDAPGKGFVPVSEVVGRAFVITWPFDRFGAIDSHHSVFRGVPDATPSPGPSG